MERRLGSYDFTAIVLDCKRFGDDSVIITVGITMAGEKVMLGLIQSDTENHVMVGDFLRGLVNRGLSYDRGLLVLIDGSKGFRKAIMEVFGKYGVVQRCQWHNREIPSKLKRKIVRKRFAKPWPGQRNNRPMG